MSAMNRAHNVLPPTQGKIVVLTADSTSRVYDLGAVDLGGERVELGGTMCLRMISEATFYFKFGPDQSMTVDDSAADAAGDGPTFQQDAAAMAPANTFVDITTWHRIAHRYLAIKGNGKVRIWVTSERSNR